MDPKQIDIKNLSGAEIMHRAVTDMIRNGKDKVFYAHLMLDMSRLETKHIETMAVGIVSNRLTLMYNPDFLKRLTFSEIQAVVEHECLHVIMDHLGRGFGLIPKVHNIAADMAINQMIQGLPKDCVLPKPFKFPEKLSSEQYYILLQPLIKRYKIVVKHNCPAGAPKQCPKDGQATGENSGGKQDGKQKGGDSKSGDSPNKQKGEQQGEGGGQGEGQGVDCGSCPHAGGKDCPMNSGAGGTIEIYDEQGNLVGKIVDDHGSWKEAGDPKNKDLNREIIKDALSKAREQTQKSRGTMPHGIEEAIDDWMKPPTIPWQVLLKEYITNSIKCGSKSSWKRQSRRFGSLQKGKLPDRTVNLMVAVDTSGSMDEEALNEAIAEIKGIQKCYKNETLVIECDAKVQATYKLKPETRVKPSFKGRGGTEYTPVFEYISDNKLKPDVLIYISDMFCPVHEKDKPLYNVIWCATSHSAAIKDIAFGKCVKIEKTKNK